MSARKAHANPTLFCKHCGRHVSLSVLAAETGIPVMTLYQRWHRGDRDARLIRPPQPYRGTRA